ncbi:hypothetical protein CH378_21315, partial [Leptospira kmetyi]
VPTATAGIESIYVFSIVGTHTSFPKKSMRQRSERRECGRKAAEALAKSRQSSVHRKGGGAQK